MRKLTTVGLFLILSLLSTSYAGVVAQSDLNGQVLLDGDKVTQNTHDYGEGKFEMPVKGAKLIWGPNWDSSKKGEKRLF